jgi:hypothetical protein
MSRRSVISIFILGIVAGISALIGTIAGGVFVFSYLQYIEPTPTIEILPKPTKPVLRNIPDTTPETTITQSVEEVGPTVVTVVGELSGRPVSGSGFVICFG